ncbi:hypothetical protein IDR12_000447 [Salmonella enterica]|nr:hypothetical protein [Salmonella enterica]
MNHVLLTRKWILLSLVLLSTDILAAESLNFDYKRSDTLSLEPRLGVQARACHSKADPMDITVRFNRGINIAKPFEVMLSINGEPYPKSYGVFSSSAKSSAGIDPDFLVPWNASAKGTTQVDEWHRKNFQAVPAENSDPFCFTNEGARYRLGYYLLNTPAFGLLPIFQKPPFSDGLSAEDFKQICQRKFEWMQANNPNFSTYASTYWPRDGDGSKNIVHYKKIKDISGTDSIEKDIDDAINHRGGAIYALAIEKGAGIFYAKRKEGQSGGVVTQNTIAQNDRNENCTTSSCNFNIATGTGNAGNILHSGGSYLVKLNNRNITSLTLTVVYDEKMYTWNWQRDGSSLLSNRLFLVNSTEGRGTVLPAGIDADDPYEKFYKKGGPGFYRGTLVPEGILNMGAYNDYNNIIPLSLPSNKVGDINLVNTDSITFTIGAGSNNVPTLGILGQPLKFAPLTSDGKEVASAMQVRNTCY